MVYIENPWYTKKKLYIYHGIWYILKTLYTFTMLYGIYTITPVYIYHGIVQKVSAVDICVALKQP